ncbi:hypothetical protein A3G06_01055 [Candidatus Nomurabacteria bacterium RIFCSPLOWO2_12_FULL_46_14]|uniref:Mannose-6-phosphate isomerase type II C-terminal domain-containing protein n=1 Tax=Candidatus Nomurabacteria bacterium RIFCSPLOWO2_12_FULL_46_14 TaxID=1801797 RepID=A0A1F6Y8F2_9BACT|nr:MAG: hypothetical protein A3G06_01055 [Candidatus Nomurabacteria bacterium RIFCSPLOWO2_12_FULL_46_14]
MASELKVFQVERPWGNFRQFSHNLSSTVKILSVKPDEELSLQSHQERAEFWRVLEGEAKVWIGETEYNAKAGDEFNIPALHKHKLQAGPQGISVLEIATGVFDENDEIRYEDKYGRA